MTGRAAGHEVGCEQFAAGLVTDYMEGDLDPVRRRLVTLHLADCARCRALLERMRAVALLLRSIGP